MPHSPYFTGPLYTRMAEDLHLEGMSQRTHDGYLRAVRKLADFCQTAPDKITEDVTVHGDSAWRGIFRFSLIIFHSSVERV